MLRTGGVVSADGEDLFLEAPSRHMAEQRKIQEIYYANAASRSAILVLGVVFLSVCRALVRAEAAVINGMEKKKGKRVNSVQELLQHDDARGGRGLVLEPRF